MLRSLRIETPTILLLAIAIALAGGYVATSDDVRLAGLLIAVVGATSVLLNPSAGLYLLVFTSLVAVGLTQLYFPQLQLIRWIVAGTAIALGFYAFVTRSLTLSKRSTPLSAGAVLMYLLMFLAIMSAVLNDVTVDVAMFGLKGYLQVIGIFFALSLMLPTRETVEKLPQLLIYISYLQIPFVLHQYIVLVPQRIGIGDGIVAEDIVAGTLGASLYGGGSNAVLSLLQITVISLLAGLYKNHRIRLATLLVLIGVCIFPLFVNANRAALLYLPIAYVVLFKEDVANRPLRILISGAIVAGIVAVMLWANATLVSRSSEFTDWRELLSTTIERNTDKTFGWGEYELNRFTVLGHWAQEHSNLSSIPAIIIGHGPGASREAEGSSLDAITLARREYPSVGIGLTGVSSILWELGVLGLLIVAALFWWAYRASSYLIHRFDEDPLRKGIVEGIRAACVVLGISLFLKNAFVFHLPFQTLLFVLFGILAFWQQQERVLERNRDRAQFGPVS